MNLMDTVLMQDRQVNRSFGPNLVAYNVKQGKRCMKSVKFIVCSWTKFGSIQYDDLEEFSL